MSNVKIMTYSVFTGTYNNGMLRDCCWMWFRRLMCSYWQKGTSRKTQRNWQPASIKLRSHYVTLTS